MNLKQIDPSISTLTALSPIKRQDWRPRFVVLLPCPREFCLLSTWAWDVLSSGWWWISSGPPEASDLPLSHSWV